MKKETEFQVARDGEIIGSFSYMTASSKASFGTLRPSDYAYINKKGKRSWVHLYKVLEVIWGEFFDELGESELEKELKSETQKADELLNLYKKALDTETDKKKLKEFSVKIVEYEKLLKHLSGTKERIRENQAEEEAEEKRDLEEDRKAIEAEMKEKKQLVGETLRNLTQMIKKAKKSGEDVESYFDWYDVFQFELQDYCQENVTAKSAEAYFKAFKRLQSDEAEIKSLAEKIVHESIWSFENGRQEEAKKEVAKIFGAFLQGKGVLGEGL